MRSSRTTRPHWTRFKLKNGLEVFLVEFHDLPLVDFSLIVKTGWAANPPDKAGLADLTARMLDEGTKTRGALEIADQVAGLGATLVDRRHLGRVQRRAVDADRRTWTPRWRSSPTWSRTPPSTTRSSRGCGTTC